MTVLLSYSDRNEIEETVRDYLDEDAFCDCSSSDNYSQIHTLEQLDELVERLQVISKNIYEKEDEKQKLVTEITDSLERILGSYEFKGDVCELLDCVADRIRKNYY
jgi:hypothetical protein